MRKLRMILALAFMVPAWAILGGFAWLDSTRPSDVVVGTVGGGAIGVFFGVVFGGAKGKWLDFLFPPEQEEEGIEQENHFERWWKDGGKKPDRQEKSPHDHRAVRLDNPPRHAGDGIRAH